MKPDRETFLALYPQFSAVPGMVLDFLFAQAALLNPALYLDRYEEAVYLYCAHKATLYLRTLPPDPEKAGAAQVASAGSAQGNVTSKSVGGVSVSMGESTAAAGLQAWGDLATTEYGLQLIALARALSRTVYVP